MARTVNDVLRIMRLAISRRNENDADSTDAVLLQYVNDFVSLTMSDELRQFHQYGTLTFNIDETNTTGEYTFNDVGADSDFVSISGGAFISITDPVEGSLSWTPLQIYQSPTQFYSYWGVNNTDVLIVGMPSAMLFYGNQFVFRTIPDQEYTVNIYGYKKQAQFGTDGNETLEFDYMLRFIAYGAALQYATDYRFDDNIKASLNADYNKEKRLMLTRTHNQITMTRGLASY